MPDWVHGVSAVQPPENAGLCSCLKASGRGKGRQFTWQGDRVGVGKPPGLMLAANALGGAGYCVLGNRAESSGHQEISLFDLWIQPKKPTSDTRR